MPVSATSHGRENLTQPPGFASLQVPAGGVGKMSLSRAPNIKEYKNKVKITAGHTQKPKILVNGVSEGTGEW